MTWFTQWFRGVRFGIGQGVQLLPKNSRRQAPGKRRTQRLCVEHLEDRTVPSAGWAASFGTTGGTWAQGVAVDPSHSAVYFSGTTIAKYSTDGNLLWSQVLAGQSLGGCDVAVDSAGDAYVAGRFTGTLPLGSQTLVSAGDQDAFIAKFDPSGNVLWAKGFGAAGIDIAGGIALDATGVYVVGRYSNTVNFDASHSLTSAGNEDIYVMKLDTSGNLVYVTQAGGAGMDAGYCIAVDGSGQAYITGFFAGTATFGSLTLTAAGTYDGFIGQVDATGNFTWVRQVGGPNELAAPYDQAYGIALDGSGHLFASGNFIGTGAFGDSRDGAGATSLTALGTYDDAFVTSLDAATGNFLWTKQIGGASDTTTGNGLALDAAGNIYTVGSFSGPSGTGIDCDPSPANAFLTISNPNTSRDGYVAELSPTGNFLGAWQMGGSVSTNTYTKSIAIGPDGSIYTDGFFVDSASFDTGTGYVTLNSSGGDAFVSRMAPGQSVILGQVFKDQNHNGVKDAGEAPFAGVTVYLDTNNNGVRDAGEPYTTTNAQGAFSFYHLAPGTYTVREVAPSGYAITTATSFTVSLAAGQFDDNSSFGDYKTPKTTVYFNTRSVTTSRRNPNAISSLSISDSYPIQDLNITLTVTNNAHLPLTIYLYAPDGTTVTLATNVTSTGTLTYHVPSLIGKNVTGRWTLEVDGLSGGTLNSWSLSVLG